MWVEPGGHSTEGIIFTRSTLMSLIGVISYLKERQVYGVTVKTAGPMSRDIQTHASEASQGPATHTSHRLAKEFKQFTSRQQRQGFPANTFHSSISWQGDKYTPRGNCPSLVTTQCSVLTSAVPWIRSPANSQRSTLTVQETNGS